MTNNIKKIRHLYDSRSKHGEFSTLAPGSKGGLKSKYVASVFDAALTPMIAKLDANKNILDYGCGTGIFIKKIEHYPVNTTGCDISFEMLKIAKEVISEKKKSNVFMVDGETLPIASNSFDCILAREVLCHVSEDIFSNVLEELYRCLKPGGIFILLDQVSQSKKWQNYKKTPLIKKRSIENILDASSKAGLCLINHYVVRKPRFFWIYLFQFRVLPNALVGPLSKTEVWFNKKYSRVKTNRWHDVLFEFTKNNTSTL